MALSGILAVLSVLLIASGLHTVRNPRPAAQALYRVGFRLPNNVVAAGGVCELVLGILGLVSASVLVRAGMILAYAGFATFLVLLLRRSPGASCGCLGDASIPPSRLHAALNLLASLLVIAAVAYNQASPVAALIDLRYAAAPLLLGAATLSVLLISAVRYVPDLATMRVKTSDDLGG